MIYRIKSFGEPRYTPMTWSPFSIELIILSIKKSVQVGMSFFYENQIDIQIVFCFRLGHLLICCTVFPQIL